VSTPLPRNGSRADGGAQDAGRSGWLSELGPAIMPAVWRSPRTANRMNEPEPHHSRATPRQLARCVAADRRRSCRRR